MTSDPSVSQAPYRIYNIGNGQPVDLMAFVRTIEQALGRTAKIHHLPLQPGDVVTTWADTSDMEREFGYRPATPLAEGVGRFVEWYRAFYK